MQQLTGNSTLGKQIGQMLSNSVTMTQKPTDPITVADAAQASKEAGFNVRLPQNLTPSRISVDKGFAFSFKVDRERAQALIDEAGRKDLQSASLDRWCRSIGQRASRDQCRVWKLPRADD